VDFPIKDYYTATELMEYARLIIAKDPGNTGGKVTGLEFPTSYAYMAFVAPNSAYCATGSEFYIGEDGKYQWGPANQETLAGLKLFRQAYDEGLLNPEFTQ
jgi:putative aldouronate transport system substrate-binding protein